MWAWELGNVTLPLQASAFPATKRQGGESFFLLGFVRRMETGAVMALDTGTTSRKDASRNDAGDVVMILPLP